jgi:transaldolase
VRVSYSQGVSRELAKTATEEAAVSTKKTEKFCRMDEDAHAHLEDVRRLTGERNQADAVSVVIKFVATPAGAAALQTYCDGQAKLRSVAAGGGV